MATIKSSSSSDARPRAKAFALLTRRGGATVSELVSATGWQPHSLRAILSGLRKAGHHVIRTKRGKETCYAITSED